MSRNDKRMRREPSLCADLHDDDGVDPRAFFKPPRGRGNNRKVRQLCAQVVRALGLALAADFGDPALQELVVESAAPAPDASRLKVILRAPSAHSTAALADLETRVARVHGRLRREVAAAITRKRAPELTLLILPREDQP